MNWAQARWATPGWNQRASRGGTVRHKRWALRPYRQFDLVRTDDGSTYLTRWWLLATPWFGVCLHRMRNGDARETVHDHPFAFVSVVLRGGYVERRLYPQTMEVNEYHRVRRVNVMRHGDAHSIRQLLRVPTWTLLFVGRHRRTWGFWEPLARWVQYPTRSVWRWTQHDAFDSGHYVP